MRTDIHANHEGDQIISRRLEERIRKLREDWEVPGLSVAIVISPKYTHRSQHQSQYRVQELNTPESESANDGWRTQFISSGVRSVQGDKVTPDTIWAIASNSKFFATLALGMLINDGVTLPSGEHLSWDTTVKEALDWKLVDKVAEEQTTIGDMLSMQSGLPGHGLAAKEGSSPAEILEQMAFLRPNKGLRQKWQYNNHPYYIIPLFFDKYAKMSFVEFVQKRIFDPLGMEATYDVQKAIESGRLSQIWMGRHDGDETKCKVEGDVFPKGCFASQACAGYWDLGANNPFYVAPLGVMASTRDMAKWLREHLEPKIIPQSVIQEVLAGRMVIGPYPRIPETGLDVYCLGHWTYTYRGFQIYQHTGSTTGQTSLFVRVPDQGLGIFAECNQDDTRPDIVDVVVHMILDHLLGLDPIDWAGRAIEEAMEGYGQSQKRPDHSNPRPAENIRGMYHNPAYGTFDIQPVSPDDKEAAMAFGEKEGYMAKIDRATRNRIGFTHVDGPIWQWQTAMLCREWYEDGSLSKDFNLYEKGASGSCVFKEDGVGFFGNIWSQGFGMPRTKPDEENTEERAEVWMKKQA